MLKQKGHVVSHTHWDREWRAPVWTSRLRLIVMFDALLDRFESDPGYRAFLLDGQFIAVEDYLDSRPEKRPVIEKAVQDGRLFIGPWYNLPDEYPVCGEALIRNLQWGIQKSNELGKALMIGYTSFGWGQTAHLPQIYAGFGIKTAVIGKHVSKDRAPASEFFWESPDGTRLLTTRLGANGRANFYFTVVLPLLYKKDYHDPKWGLQWPGSGLIIHKADRDKAWNEHDYRPQLQYDYTELEKCVTDLWQTTEDTTVKEHRFLGDGCDYTGPTPNLDELIARINQTFPDRELKHSNLVEYMNAISENVDPEKISTVRGELRDGPAPACSANALATRINLKILNRKAQTALIEKAEPFTSLARLMGIECIDDIIHKAWKYLLRSHSHDAINGVTTDKTSNDISYRLSQVIELSEALFDDIAAKLIERMDFSSFSSNDIPLVIFNPTPHIVDTIQKVTLDLPADWNSQYLTAADADQNPLAVQHLASENKTAALCVQNSRAIPFEVTRHEIAVETGPLPPMGYKVIHFRCAQSNNPRAKFWPVHHDFGTLRHEACGMENEYFSVTINSDATFDLLYKPTDKLYINLNAFEDSGEAGDYWQRVEPQRNQVFSTLGRPAAEITLVEDGPLLVSYRCVHRFGVPASVTADRKARSEARVPLEIVSTISLQKNEPFVRIHTRIKNKAKDHRIRVIFPSDLDTDTVLAQGHFGIDRRPVALPFDSKGKRDAHMNTLPMQRYVAMQDSQQGLALVNQGLTEYEVTDNASRSICLTLLRSVPMKICAEFRCALEDPNQLGSQCLGAFEHEYAVCPFEGALEDSAVSQAADIFSNSPVCYQAFNHHKGSLPLEHSFFSVTPSQVQLIALKQPSEGHGLIVRLFNPLNEMISTCIDMTDFETKHAFITDMNESPIKELAIWENRVHVDIDSQKILTILIQ